MGYYCTVPQCTSLAGKTKNVKFHRFPRDVCMADKWNDILKRGKPYTQYSKVCSLHFTQADYNVTTMGQWKTLSKDAVPSQNLPKLNPDGTVMVIRKSRTVKYPEGKTRNSDKADKWASINHGGHSLMSGQETLCTSHEMDNSILAYRLQTLGALANNISPQHSTPLSMKPKKQDAIMQTDPVQNEDDDTQPNNSYSEVSDKSYNSEVDYTQNYPKNPSPYKEVASNYPKDYQRDQNQYKDGSYSRESPYKETYPKDGYPNTKDGYQNAKDGYTKDSYPNPKDGYANPKDSYPNPKDGYSTPKDGYSPTKDGYSTPKDGYSNPKDGYPNPKDGYSTPKDGYPNPKDGYPNPKDVYPNPKEGYSTPKDCYPNPKDGYSTPKDGYHNTKDGYPNPKDAIDYPSKTFAPKDYTKSSDYIPQTNDEYNKEAEEYALIRKSNYEMKDYPKHVYQKLDMYSFDKYQREGFYQNGYTDSADILRNQQNNLALLQGQRIAENQSVFSEGHIKQEIDISGDDEKFLYDRTKEQLESNPVYAGRRHQLILEHLQQQVKQEPDVINGCDNALQPQGSPYYTNGHNNVAGFYDPLSRPGPELLIAKQNALAVHTQLWQNTMKRPHFYYSETTPYNNPHLHRHEDVSRVLQ